MTVALIDGLPFEVFTDDDNKYVVEKIPMGEEARAFEFRLQIQRKDKKPMRSWRELQDIKNAVAGTDRYAAEIYPPESEVTDTANIYHLWVFKEGYHPGVSLIPRAAEDCEKRATPAPVAKHNDPPSAEVLEAAEAYRRLMNGD
jgi:hypothetical protein